jgi:GNAT superfamily N-acetyltransferase
MSIQPIQFESVPDPMDLEFLQNQINQYNITATGYTEYFPLAAFIRDENNQILAGISGGVWGGFCEIDFLWVHADFRAQGYGGQLLAAAEAEARRHGCTWMVLDTFSFQAPDFYPKFGYESAGMYPDCPTGYQKHFFQKRLK